LPENICGKFANFDLSRAVDDVPGCSHTPAGNNVMSTIRPEVTGRAAGPAGGAPHGGPPLDPIGPLVVRPTQAMLMLNCGREQLYELINAGELDSYLDGAARKITVASIHQRIERKLAEAKSVRDG
jgi:hypothetical protein